MLDTIISAASEFVLSVPFPVVPEFTLEPFPTGWEVCLRWVFDSKTEAVFRPPEIKYSIYVGM